MFISLIKLNFNTVNRYWVNVRLLQNTNRFYSNKPYESGSSRSCRVFLFTPCGFAFLVSYLMEAHACLQKEVCCMNKTQRDKVCQMRSRGDSYASIGAITNIPVGTVKAFCSRNAIKPDQPELKGICDCCGKGLEQQVPPQVKRFCSVMCRNTLWHNNRDKRVRNGATHVCAHCNKEYLSYESESKYCSHPCYIAHRFGKEAGHS